MADRLPWLISGCGMALGALGLVTWAAIQQWLPVFFIPGPGGTPLRYCVLISAIVAFTISSAMLAGRREERTPFTSWYAPSMSLLAVGLFGIMIQPSLWSVINWLARTAQWLGGLYLLLAAVAAVRQTGAWNINQEARVWAQRRAAWEDRLLRVLAPRHIWSLPLVWRLAVVLVITAAATALRWALIPWIGTSSPYNIALVAIITTVILTGFVPGLLAVALNHLGVELFVVSTSPELSAEPRAIRIAISISIGIFVCIVFHGLRTAQLRWRDREQRFRAAFDDVAVGMTMTSLDLQLTHVNAAFCRMLGYSEQELIGRFVAEITHEDDLPPNMSELQRAVRGESDRFGMEKRYLRKDGTIACGLMSTAVVRDEQGRPAYLVTHIQDITERKEAEARIAADLDALSRMHALSGRALQTEGVPILQEAMDTAVAVMGAARGTLQLLEGETLRIVAQHKHEQPFLDYFSAAENVTSVCGEATRQGKRVVVHDVETSPLFAGEASLPVLRAAGVRAVQSTPMMSRDGRLLGILTTQWDAPHVPDEHALWRLDLLVRQVADLIEQRQAEEALRESEQNYRNLFTNMTEEVHFWRVIRDEQGKIKTWRLVDANPPTLKTWGRTSIEEIRGCTTDEIFGPGATEHYMPVVVKILSEGLPHSFEDYFPNLDRWFRFSSVPLGEYFITTGTDITDIKKSQEALSRFNAELEQQVSNRTYELMESQEKLRSERQRLFDVLETVPAMVCLLTPDYHIAFANRSFRQRFGESNGRRCYEYCFGNVEPCDFCQSYKVLQTGKPHRWELETPDGSVIEAHDFPFTDADGSSMILEMDIDITDMRKAQSALQESRDTLEIRVAERTAELARSNKELEQFAYIASHDLQEPLRQVMSFGKLLGQRYADSFDDKGQQFMTYMIEGSQRMSDLVKGLLDYSRVAPGDAPRQPVAADQVLDTAITNLRLAIDESQASVVYGRLATVLVDPVQVGQLFQNLIANAIKFRREEVKPEIQVGCRTEGETCTFWVKDNGIGIPADLHERAFVIFQRLHGQGKYPGTGIGLAICKKIVENHGGLIWIESTVGEGSTFFFTLPLAKEAV